MTKTNEEKFWSKVNKLGPNDCWPWLGAKHPTGYGKLWLRLPDLICKPAHHAALILTAINAIFKASKHSAMLRIGEEGINDEEMYSGMEDDPAQLFCVSYSEEVDF